MKKNITYLLLLAALSLASCGGTTSDSTTRQNPATADTPVSQESVDSKTGSESMLPYSDVRDPYTVGTKTNDTAYNYDGIYVNQPKNSLNEDFLFGADISSLYEVEKNGGRFYNREGKEQDVFEILKDGGTNTIRLRLWVDPYSAGGVSYGGGTNDISTDIYLAKRANRAGLRVLVDFHYSDSWADPGKQYAPKAWKGLSDDALVSKVRSYTTSALLSFRDAGVDISHVQIGNETNNGIAGHMGGADVLTSRIYTAGIEGAKAVYPDVKSIIHLTNITNTKGLGNYTYQLSVNHVPYDILGVSYYPYWHGDKANLQTVLNDIATKRKKKVMIMETSWGYTDDPHDYVNNQYSSSGFGMTGGYETSPQGQSTEMADLVDVLSQVPNNMGAGLCYWEPAWLPVQGSGWISKAGAYYNDHGTDAPNGTDLDSLYTDSYCYQSWANQAWFDYSGKVLPSAYTYQHIKDGDKTVEEAITGLVQSESDFDLNLSDEESTLPETAVAVTNTGAHRNVAVTWNKEEVDAMYASGAGKYDIHGTINGTEITVTLHVTAQMNYIQDPSFEKQADGQEVAVGAPWALTSSVSGAARIESKSEGNRTGTKYFHWYSTSAFTYSLSQDLGSVPAGTYVYNMYMLASALDDTSTGSYSGFDLWYQVNGGKKVTLSVLDKCKGWGTPLRDHMLACTMDNIVLKEASQVTIGLDCAGGAKSWGHCDDFSFSPVIAG